MITRDLEMRVHDLKPDMVVDIVDRSTNPPTPVDFTTASAVVVSGTKNGVVAINRRTVTGASDGSVTMLWQAGDTATPGTYTFEVEAMWPGSKPQTFRAQNRAVIKPDMA